MTPDDPKFDEVAFQTLWADPDVDVITAAAASIEDQPAEPTPSRSNLSHTIGLACALIATLLVMAWLIL